MRLYVRMSLFLLMVGFIPIAVMSGFYLTKVENMVRSTTHGALAALATEVGKEVEREVREGYKNILLLAQNPVIVSSTASRQEQQEELTRTQKFHRIFKDISFLNTKGQVRASVFYSFRGEWNATDWFKSASAGKSVLSDVHAVPYPFEVVMTAAAPVRDKEGSVKGVLVGQLDMERVWGITRNVSAGKKGSVLLVDQHGILIASPDPKQLLEPVQYNAIHTAAVRGEKAVFRLNGKTGPEVGVSVPITRDDLEDEPLAWSVVILQAQNEAYAPVYRARYGVLLAVMACLLLVGILSPALSCQVSNRVSKLVEAAKHLGQGNLSEKIEDLGGDEIGDLGRAFNWASNQLASSRQKIIEYNEHLEELVKVRTSELEAVHTQLVEAAHMAGMAEIATGVLHNIGNAINSVNIRINLVKEKIDCINVQRLLQVAELFESNAGKLDNYLSSDPRGQKVLPYLKLTLNNLHDHREDILSDLHFLDSQVNHICEIVILQQSYAKGKGEFRESCRIDEILMDSVRIQKDFLDRNEIAIETDFTYSEPMLLERHQLIQVFVNLIRNAAQSIAAAQAHGIISLFIRLAEDSGSPMVEVSIKDTGAGFPPELKTTIFQYGFSTKKEGKGFGLHFCANYIQSIGGSIRAESEGPDRGAQLIVQIPIERQG